MCAYPQGVRSEASAERVAADPSGPLLADSWAPRLRLLFLTDGRITDGHGTTEFGLGPPIDTLTDRAVVPWLDISVEFVDRDQGFRLTQDGFDIDAYDQVWLFGDNPSEEAAQSQDTPDSVAYLAQYAPMSDAELLLLARWMDLGGGVFATGDHSFLGASMCSRIPRVRTMRMWTHAQGVPSLVTPERHETLQHIPGISYDGWEGDPYAQRIFPVYQGVPGRFALGWLAPHPLLCGPHGVIDRFPDHMHEGSVIEDADLELDLPLDIAGYSPPEYPPYRPVLQGAVAGLSPGVPPPLSRPVPHVVAHGMTTNNDAPPRSFGLVGAYDGQGADVGRVVVDSTWHHWFSLNLHGFISQEPLIYTQLQWYYRNIAVYLATPAQRAQMLFAAIWNGLMNTHPGAFSRGFNVWESGRRAVDVLGHNAPQCLVSALVSSVMPPVALAAAPAGDAPLPGLDPDLVNAAIAGGIALEMVERANQVLLERAKGRHLEVDAREILERGWAGVTRGHRELIGLLSEQVRAQEALRAALERMEPA
jgi:hypothetical protein